MFRSPWSRFLLVLRLALGPLIAGGGLIPAVAAAGAVVSPAAALQTPARGVPSPAPRPPDFGPPPAPPPQPAPEVGEAPDLSAAAPAAPAMPVVPALQDSVLHRAYVDAMAAYLAAVGQKNRLDQATLGRLAGYHGWALDNRRRVIDRQQTIGVAVFVVAVTLVFTGIVFSGIQFYIAMRHARTADAVAPTTIRASLGSVEVSSSILGVIILVISLGFFYLYLEHVFRLGVLPD